MRTCATVTLIVLIATCALAQQADVALVKGTFAFKDQPGSAQAVSLYSGVVATGLRQAGVKYDVVPEEKVAQGKLAGYRLAIFPYNTVFHDDEMAQVVKFVQGGGKLMWFYTVPPALRELLGVGKYGYRGVKYPGEFSVMQFAADAPPGFPAQVHQQSPNSRIVEELAKGARAIATWRDKAGKDTGVPAVILTPQGLWVSHVFWADADAAEQRHLLLATVGHFIPGKWREIVEGMIGAAAPAAGYESLEALASATRGKDAASEWAKKTLAQAAQAKEALAADKFSEALTFATEAQSSAQIAVAATFPSRPYELRGAWMGTPAEDVNWDEIMSELQAANFNAIFPLMCGPTSALYPSDVLPQTSKTDQMKACLEAARRHGIEVHVWRANWQVLSRGDEQRHQQFIKEGRMVLSAEQAMGKTETSHYQWSNKWLDPSDERNRELEFNAMIELVQKYHPAGIHFDFMRYPESRYCYCNRCRTKFEEWAGLKVEKWPGDCWTDGKHVAKYRDWRRHLMTSLVKRIADRAHEIDPNVKVSLAARSSLTGSFESDAQDWVTWARTRYLDMLCPMDYTGSVEELRNKLEPQLAAIDGVIPVYAGIGVSPGRSASPSNLSQQMKLARELGADGFLIFSLSPFSRDMLPAIKLGVTSVPVRVMPHHAQPARATFRYPDGIQALPKRTYAAGTRLTLPISVAAVPGDAQRVSVEAFVMPAGGGEERAASKPLSGEAIVQEFTVDLPPDAGIYSVILRGEVVLKDGTRRSYYLRSQPLGVLTPEQVKQARERL